jgi:hypothetical protein
MATNTESIVGAEQRLLSTTWLIGEKDDLVWIIGSVAASYALLVFYAGGWLPLAVMVGCWAVLIDGPHVFGTISRTYLDRSEWHARRRLLTGSLLFFLVGPVLVLAGYGLEFFFVAALWAYYHLVKQHYGFMVLYKKKNGDLERVDNTLDRALLLAAFSCPFIAYIARDPDAMTHVPQILRPTVNTLYMAVLALTLAFLLAWLARQVQRAITGRPLNLPKYLLLAAAIPMHWFALLTPMPYKTIALVPILTTYHNLQYHRLIWFHNRKYSGERAREQFGAAATVSRNLIVYAGFALLFGIIYQGPRQYILALEFRQPTSWTVLATAFLWGFAFNHYYLDSKIWRVRRDPSVGKALKME